MHDRVLNTWQVVRAGLWFVPTLCTGLAMVLAFGMLELDRRFTTELSGFLFAGGPEEAREILATIAGSIITVAGVAFSVTIVALTLAGSQYGSLLLASYLRDPVDQVALGVFLGTFVYCLIVLGYAVGGAGFLAPFSVTFGMVLAVASLGMFVAFIHHLAQTMRPDRLAARVGENLLAAIAEMFPDPVGDERTAEHADAKPPDVDKTGCPVRAPRSGYLQAVEWDRLMAFARRRGLVVHVVVHAGDFVSEGAVVAYVSGADEAAWKRVGETVGKRLVIGHVRTPTQDPEYSVHQLSQVAVRALSPSLNDPYTALTCIDWLETALRRLTGRRHPAECRFDREGHLRLVLPHQGFELVANAAFNKIRHAGRTDASILMRLAIAAGNIAAQVTHSADRELLRRIVTTIHEEALAGLPTQREKEEVAGLCRRTLEGLG